MRVAFTTTFDPLVRLDTVASVLLAFNTNLSEVTVPIPPPLSLTKYLSASKAVKKELEIPVKSDTEIVS